MGDKRDRQCAEPIELLELVPLYLDRHKAFACIRMQALPVDWEALRQLLVAHRDIFAWRHEDMSGIDNVVIEHHLGVDPT